MKPPYNALFTWLCACFSAAAFAQPFIPVQLPKPNVYVTTVTDVAEDANGDLYIGTDAGLLVKRD